MILRFHEQSSYNLFKKISYNEYLKYEIIHISTKTFKIIKDVFDQVVGGEFNFTPEDFEDGFNLTKLFFNPDNLDCQQIHIEKTKDYYYIITIFGDYLDGIYKCDEIEGITQLLLKIKNDELNENLNENLKNELYTEINIDEYRDNLDRHKKLVLDDIVFKYLQNNYSIEGQRDSFTWFNTDYMGIDIERIGDDWYLVSAMTFSSHVHGEAQIRPGQKFFKCDGFEGLKKLLSSSNII